MTRRLPVIVAALAIAAPPAAAAAAAEVSRPVSSGAFAAQIVPTSDAKRFTDEWDRPGARVEIHVDEHVKLGGSVTAFVVIKGCAVDARGACDVGAEISLVDPAGKVLGPAVIQVIAGPPAQGAGVFMRSQAAPTFGFDSGDKAGRYLIRAKVTDKVAGASVGLEQAVAYEP